MVKMMKNKLALFDLDGTLFNTNDVNYYSYKEALNNLGYDLDYEYFCTKCNGRFYKEFLPEITDGKDSTLETIHKQKKELYGKYLDKAKINNHLINIAKHIKDEYYLAVVTTASKKNTMDILKYYKIESLFDLILTHDDITKVKPDPEGFLKAMNYFKIDCYNTIIFEDSKPGIEAARRTNSTVFVIDKF